MKGGCRSRIGRRMANGRHCRQIVNEAVVKRIATVYQPSEATVSKLCIIARQIVPSHLVNNNADHQFGPLAKLWTVIFSCCVDSTQQNKHY